jgi:basic membrane protein A
MHTGVTMKKKLILCVAMVFFLLQGCAAQSDTNEVKIAYITDASGEKSEPNVSVIEAMNEILEYDKFSYKIYSCNSNEECEKNAEAAYSSDYDMIIGSSNIVNNYLMSCKSNDGSGPDIALIGNVDDNQNTLSIDFKMEEASFLAGVLAASESETGIIGYVGGYEDELVNYEVGYYTGAKTVNPDIQIISVYTDSYNNVSEGYTQANSLISQNVDVIFANCAASSLGVSKAANEQDVYIIYSDLYSLQDNDNVLGITTKDYKKVALYVIDLYLNEEFTTGNYRYGITYDMVGFETTDAVSDDLKNLLNDYRIAIRDYSIEIPATWNAYKNFDYSSFIQ